MKKSLLLVALLVLAPGARASGLALRWDACAGEGTGTSVRAFACDKNVGQDLLVGSFVPGVAMTGLAGIEITVFVDTCPFIVGSPCGSVLPAWWQCFNAGTCRQSALSATFVNDPANVVCQAWSNGAILGGIAAYQIGYPGANTARLRMAVATPSTDPGVVAADVQYLAFTLAISHAKTVGTGACAGCDQPLGVIFNSANLVPMDAGGTNVFIGNPLGGPLDHVAWWQSAPVAARATTWGAVKALYR